MDYLYYSLITLAILLLCLYLVRAPGHLRLGSNQAALEERARKRRERDRLKPSDDDHRLPERDMLHLSRELRNIPTPWGWPGHDVNSESHSNLHSNTASNAEEIHGVSGSLHRWVDHLVSEKRSVEDKEYVLKKESSMRALLEDRYGRASRMPETEYRETKAPLLRDPDQAHDQMDNFPSGRGDKIISKLGNQPRRPARNELSFVSIRKTELKEVKTPWGW